MTTAHYRGAHAAGKDQGRVLAIQSQRQPRRWIERRRRDALRSASSPRSSSNDAWDERVERSRTHGFTPRQAGFLVTVMLHAGVCLGRQVPARSRASPTARRCTTSFEQLVGKGCATATPVPTEQCPPLSRPPQAAVPRPSGIPTTGIESRPPWRGRSNSSWSSMRSWPTRTARWLGTEREKVAYFTLTHRVPQTKLPAVTFRSTQGETVRHFVDKLPIGVDPGERHHVFLYSGDTADADRLPALSGAARRAPQNPAGVDGPAPDPRHLQSATGTRTSWHSASRWARRCGGLSSKNCTWFFHTRRAGGRPVRSSVRKSQARVRQSTVSRALSRHGSSAAMSSSTPRFPRPCPRPWHVGQVAWSVMSYRIRICISPPWLAPRKGEPSGQYG